MSLNYNVLPFCAFLSIAMIFSHGNQIYLFIGPGTPLLSSKPDLRMQSSLRSCKLTGKAIKIPQQFRWEGGNHRSVANTISVGVR